MKNKELRDKVIEFLRGELSEGVKDIEKKNYIYELLGELENEN